jgi:hypothetical protein
MPTIMDGHLVFNFQYFTKGVQMPKRFPKIGCGPFGARTLFSGLSLDPMILEQGYLKVGWAHCLSTNSRECAPVFETIRVHSCEFADSFLYLKKPWILEVNALYIFRFWL